MESEKFKNYFTVHFGHYLKSGSLEREYDFLHPYFKEEYLKLLPRDKEASCLDLASGIGTFLYFLKKSGYKNILGVDISEEMVSISQKMGLEVILGDGFEFLKNSEEEIYDVIVANSFLEHFLPDEGEEMMKLCFRALKKGGRIILRVPNMASPLMGNLMRYIDLSHRMGFSEESLSALLRFTGFRKIKIYPAWSPIYSFYLDHFIRYLTKPIDLIIIFLFRIYGRRNTKILTKEILGYGEK